MENRVLDEEDRSESEDTDLEEGFLELFRDLFQKFLVYGVLPAGTSFALTIQGKFTPLSQFWEFVGGYILCLLAIIFIGRFIHRH